jgi:hypothetical protein
MGRNKRKKYSNFNNFVAIPRRTLNMTEWKELSAAAKLFYIHLKSKYNKQNNGEISFHYSELKGNKGISSPHTISKAIRELEEKRWIKKTQLGGLFRHVNKFQLTGEYDDHL